jgi:hypothetical protein
LILDLIQFLAVSTALAATSFFFYNTIEITPIDPETNPRIYMRFGIYPRKMMARVV